MKIFKKINSRNKKEQREGYNKFYVEDYVYKNEYGFPNVARSWPSSPHKCHPIVLSLNTPTITQMVFIMLQLTR